MDQRPNKTVFVSNLNSTTTDEEFGKAFETFGAVKKAFVVRDGSKSRGFGYVIFKNADDTKKCIKSKLKLEGRTLKICKAKPKIIKKNKKGDNNNNDDDGDDNDGDEDEDECDKSPKKVIKSKLRTGSVKTVEKSDDDDDDIPTKDNLGDDDDDGSDEDEEEDMECDDADDDGDDSEGDDDDQDEEEEDEEDDDDDGEDDEDDEDEEEEDGDAKKPTRVLNNNDAEDGKTLFIRNLSFDSVEDDLEEFFEEFGDLHYCRIVMDQKSQRSRGMAFVKFRSKESAEKCLEEFKSDPEKFVITGRNIVPALAVTKEEAKNKFQNQIREDAGSKRNLHLIRVTMIRPGTKAAKGMTNEDIQMRENVIAATKEKLKNPNIFVSPNRLCIRNIPFTVDDKMLRKAFLEGAGGGKDVRITESRIMRDLTKPRANGVCWSKGFGFVAFKSHEHALAAAMATNNNPIFGENKKVIVDFSLENKAVYELRQKRMEKSQNPDKDQKTQTANKSNRKNKKFQIPERAPNKNPGKKNMPSHMGPKIRHKPREGEAKGKFGKNKKNKQMFKKNQDTDRSGAPKDKRKRKRASVKEYSDNVDVMVKKRRMEMS